MTELASGPTDPPDGSPFARAAADLIALGYHVIPIIPPHAAHGGAGKSPGNYTRGAWWGMKEWERFRDRLPTEFERALWARNFPNANIGIVCGSAIGETVLVAVDIDTTDADEFEMLISMLPRSPMTKKGEKGLTLFYRAPGSIRSKSYSVKGVRIVDLLTGSDTRQTVVPPSLHKSGAIYHWLGAPVRPAELPLFDADALEKLEDTLRGMGWDENAVHHGASAPQRVSGSMRDDDSYWGEAKQAAFQNLSAWAPQLGLYGFRPARRGFEAVATWRPSCTGRPTEVRKRNLSIQPDGITDFGTGQKYSPIDLVMAAFSWDQARATSWLRERLSLNSAAPMLAVVGEFQNEAKREIPEAAQTLEVSSSAPKSDAEVPDALTRIPGLLGELTDWISDTSRRPQRGLALGAALTLLGTAAGRRYAGPTRTGTHLYVLGLARTSAGKDHGLQQIARILQACGMGNFLGPSQFMSFQAVIGRVQRAPVSLCPMDEFGAFLARVNGSGKAVSSHERGISAVLRSLWGSSFQTYCPPEWAQKSAPVIHSPALSIYGVSTPEEFYAAIQGADITNGFLNRFLLLSTQKRPAERDPKIDGFKVPDSIVNSMKLIANGGGVLFGATAHNGEASEPAITARWASQDAQDRYRAFGREAERREEEIAFLARTVEMAQRLATIRAIGINPTAPSVDLADMQWGCELALWSAERMIAETSDHMAENPHQAEAKLVLRIIRESGKIRRRDLARRIAHKIKPRDLDDRIRSLEEADEIEIEKTIPPGGGTPTIWFSVKERA